MLRDEKNKGLKSCAVTEARMGRNLVFGGHRKIIEGKQKFTFHHLFMC